MDANFRLPGASFGTGTPWTIFEPKGGLKSWFLTNREKAHRAKSNATAAPQTKPPHGYADSLF